MKEIRLKVNDNDLDTILTILNNLKDGLVSEIDVVNSKRGTASYKPKSNRVVLEENPSSTSLNGKYIDPKAFKERLRRR